MFESSDWYVRSLSFSPDDALLAFVENYERKNLTLLDVAQRTATVLTSGVNGRQLCWSKDGAYIFCIRNGKEIWQIGVDDQSESLIFRGEDFDDKYPYLLASSPTGEQLGFGYDFGFHVIDLVSGEVTKWFDCRHYFVTFDWSDDGICYLNAVGEETQRRARLMVYNPATNTNEEVAIGPFSDVVWFRPGELLIRKDNTELWKLTIQDKGMKRIFPTKP